MHEIINFLKGAVKRDGTYVSSLNCYNFSPGMVVTRNGSIHAGINIENDLEFSVPADEFEAVLGRMKAVTALTFTGNSLTVKGGRMKATIQCIPDDPSPLPGLPDDEEAWVPVPTGLVPALALALPFIGEKGWNSGIRLKDCFVTAIRNASGIEITVPGMEVEDPISISSDAANFLVAQGSPQFYYQTHGAIMFQWENGRWLKAQLLAEGFPSSIDAIFDSAGSHAPIEITEEWKEAWADAAAVATTDRVQITKAMLSAGRNAADCEVLATTQLNDGHASTWSIKTMAPIFACATHWNPASWPNATLFVGDNLRGIVAGLRA